MLNFKDYFIDEYQFTLKKVTYTWIETNNHGDELNLNISDGVISSIQGRTLNVTFERKVFFKPEALYSIEVVFAIMLTFKETINEEEINKVNWCQELIETDNPYLRNIISRASNVISMLTSSYGQQPLITPPNIVQS